MFILNCRVPHTMILANLDRGCRLMEGDIRSLSVTPSGNSEDSFDIREED